MEYTNKPEHGNSHTSENKAKTSYVVIHTHTPPNQDSKEDVSKNDNQKIPRQEQIRNTRTSRSDNSTTRTPLYTHDCVEPQASDDTLEEIISNRSPTTEMQGAVNLWVQIVQGKSNANIFIRGVLKLFIMQLCLTTVTLRVLFLFQNRYTNWRFTTNGIVYIPVICLLLVILYLIYITQSLQYDWMCISLKLCILTTASTIIPVVVVLCLEIIWIESAGAITTTICLFLLMSILVWFPLAGTSLSFTTQFGIVLVVHLGNVFYFLWAFGISVFNGFAALAPVHFTDLPRVSKQAVLESGLATVLLVTIIVNMSQVMRRGNATGFTTHLSNIHSVVLNLYMESYCVIIRLCSCCCSLLVRGNQSRCNNNQSVYNSERNV
jgi:hypothetical protein